MSGVWGSIYPFVTDTGKWLTVKYRFDLDKDLYARSSKLHHNEHGEARIKEGR